MVDARSARHGINPPEANMPSPYNLVVEHHCTECAVRTEHPFCNMKSDAVNALNAVKFTGLYPKGSLLFVEGESPRGVFILCSGLAKLTTSSTEGKTFMLKTVDPGEILGASSSILDKPYEVSAETISPSQVNFIKRDDFLRLLDSYPEACLHIAQQLSSKYYDAQREMRTLGLSQSIGEKLVRLLLDWSARAGEQTSQGMRMKVLLTHEEIAEMIGSTRETVTRLLSDLNRKKLIAVKGSSFFLTDLPLLETMVSV